MGHPVIRGKVMEVLNARQGQTLTREQLAGLTGLTPVQVRGAMRGLVDEFPSIKVMVRAQAWRMDPDRVASASDSVAAPVAKKTIPVVRHAAVAEKPEETPQKAVPAKTNPMLTLEILGTVTDGSHLGRDETGQIWGVRKF